MGSFTSQLIKLQALQSLESFIAGLDLLSRNQESAARLEAPLFIKGLASPLPSHRHTHTCAKRTFPGILIYMLLSVVLPTTRDSLSNDCPSQ